MFLEDWNAVFEHKKPFNKMSPEIGSRIGSYLAATMLNRGQGDASVYLGALRTNDEMSCMWRILFPLDHNQLDSSSGWINRALSLQSRLLIQYASGRYDPTAGRTTISVILSEFSDIVARRRELLSDDEILRIWHIKSNYAKRNS
jgi:hypothetical protein